ncbi:hypothetical protein CC86DRAFT_41014 [Ophiobolus disseminans]|uniref:Uncharacterized protein n=1 Tax=Ophiobolus disseminans TaxID=1469910 RepID=A0A6A6ZXI9_9PLEO|nr:hypothetical protein CC86DRAFT_41014 [Ophiobolus disseminans]
MLHHRNRCGMAGSLSSAMLRSNSKLIGRRAELNEILHLILLVLARASPLVLQRGQGATSNVLRDEAQLMKRKISVRTSDGMHPASLHARIGYRTFPVLILADTGGTMR